MLGLLPQTPDAASSMCERTWFADGECGTSLSQALDLRTVRPAPKTALNALTIDSAPYSARRISLGSVPSARRTESSDENYACRQRNHICVRCFDLIEKRLDITRGPESECEPRATSERDGQKD